MSLEWVVTIALCSAAIATVVTYCADAIHYGHIHHKGPK
jgi:hypothetical protein